MFGMLSMYSMFLIRFTVRSCHHFQWVSAYLTSLPSRLCINWWEHSAFRARLINQTFAIYPPYCAHWIYPAYWKCWVCTVCFWSGSTVWNYRYFQWAGAYLTSLPSYLMVPTRHWKSTPTPYVSDGANEDLMWISHPDRVRCWRGKSIPGPWLFYPYTWRTRSIWGRFTKAGKWPVQAKSAQSWRTGRPSLLLSTSPARAAVWPS